AMRVVPDGEQVSMQVMVDAVKETYPDHTILGLGASEGDYFAYPVSVFDPDGVGKAIFVDQWRGEVTGEGGIFNIKYFFRQLHRYLFLPAPIGLTIVSSMAIILSISLYTGLKTSRNWRTLMTRIRFSKGARTAIGDAHKAAGLWSIWFFALMITTGLWYYAEFLGTDFEPEQPGYTEERAVQMGDVLPDRSVSDIIKAAQTAYPDLQISSVTFGGVVGRQATMVNGTVGNPIVRERANRVYLDPVSLEVIKVARDRDLGWVQWLNQIADPLHFGNFGGLAVKLIWFVFGLFMTGLSISGVWLTWRRLKSRGATRMQLACLPLLILAGVAGSITYAATKLPFFSGIDLFAPAWFIVGLWLGGLALLGAWLFYRRLRRPDKPRLTLLNGFYALLLLAAGGSAVHATVLQRPFADVPEQSLGLRSAGPVSSELFLATTPAGAFAGSARFMIGAVGERPNLNTMSVRLVTGDKSLGDPEDAIEKRFSMRPVIQPVFLSFDADALAKAERIEATFEMHSGNKFKSSWELTAQP
ncbi:MAG: PepSY-associated TM helix domain-containing protein, partial [Pseudomonadota bacterium]